MPAPDKKRTLRTAEEKAVEREGTSKRYALASQEKQWTDVARGWRYETKEGVGLAQITPSKHPMEWDAYDLQQTNDAKTGARFIGHFQGEKQARQAVEDYWSTIQ